MCRLPEATDPIASASPSTPTVSVAVVDPVGDEIPLGRPEPCWLGGPFTPSGSVPAVEMKDGSLVAFCGDLCRHVWLLTHEGRAVSLSGTVMKTCQGCGAALSGQS